MTYDDPLKSLDLYCYVNSIIGISAFFIELLYHCAFFLYIVLTLRKSLLKGQDNSSTIFYHIVIIIITILVVIYSIYNELIGKTLNATCSIKKHQALSDFSASIIVCLYLIFAYSSYRYMKKKIPHSNKIK